MQGIYKVIINNKVYEYRNLITNSGKLALLKAIAGDRKGWALSIVAGIGNTAAAITDKALEFPASGGDITTIITDPVNEKIYFKASLPVLDECTIYEFGCFSSPFTSIDRAENGGGMLLADISTVQEWTDVSGTHSADTVNSRIGQDALSYTITASGTVKGYARFLNDLSHVPADAQFKLAYFCENVSDLIIRFKVDDLNYYESDAWSVTDGYNVDMVQKSLFNAVGSPNWSDIQYLELEATATASAGTISLDALRYELPFTDASELLSRVVLITPQDKLSGLTLDIEYQLELDI